MIVAATTRYSWPLAAAQPTHARPRPTWAEWCAVQQRQIAIQRCFGDQPFNGRELAHLAFVRWLYHTDRIPS